MMTDPVYITYLVLFLYLKHFCCVRLSRIVWLCTVAVGGISIQQFMGKNIKSKSTRSPRCIICSVHICCSGFIKGDTKYDKSDFVVRLCLIKVWWGFISCGKTLISWLSWFLLNYVNNSKDSFLSHFFFVNEGNHGWVSSVEFAELLKSLTFYVDIWKETIMHLLCIKWKSGQKTCDVNEAVSI